MMDDPQNTRVVLTKHRSPVSLETYDPNWRVRWAAAHQARNAAKAILDWSEASRHLLEMHSAYNAQFRFAENYRDHFLQLWADAGDDVGVVPDIPDGLTLEDVDKRLVAWRQSIAVTRADLSRPPGADPDGLRAFRTHLMPGSQRLNSWFTVDVLGTGDYWRYQVAMEFSLTEAHVCFITQEAGRGADNFIETLATQFYAGCVSKPLLGLFKRQGQFRRGDLRFYTYLPWRIHQRDEFSAVSFGRISTDGFQNPTWHNYKSVPTYLRHLADSRETHESPGHEPAAAATWLQQIGPR